MIPLPKHQREFHLTRENDEEESLPVECGDEGIAQNG